MINLDVRTLTAEESRLSVERFTLGSEVRKMVLPVRSGAKLVLDHMRHQTSEQGVEEANEIEVAPNFATTRPRRGRNSNPFWNLYHAGCNWVGTYMCQLTRNLHGAS